MRMPRDIQSKAFDKAIRRFQALSRKAQTPDINTPGSRAVEAWFLGPKGENADLMKELIVQAIDSQANWRQSYHPEDPTHITDEIKQTAEFTQAVSLLKDKYTELLERLKGSVPFFSMRYQGHMNWDVTVPSVLGYFAAMLYNSNNVAFEGSTVTTNIEIEVGDDLCRMLGYTVPVEDSLDDQLRAWGHITCGGTVANIEGLWSARNLKFYPIAVKAALENDSRLEKAKGITVPVYEEGTQVNKPLIELSTWQVLNIQVDDVLSLSTRIVELMQNSGVDSSEASNILSDALSHYSVQDLGIQEFTRRFLNGNNNEAAIASPVFFVPGTKHYSWPKGAAILGMGASNMIDVEVDEHGRMRIYPLPQPKSDQQGLNGYSLKEDLDYCLAHKIPVYTVVAVIGSTEESAVDPLTEILALREEFRKKGLEFTVHADAAWGGYFSSLLRTEADFNLPAPKDAAPTPVSPLSTYMEQQLTALKDADSITIDPHKSGYIPYPAGALCYRNSAMRNLVTFVAPYVFHGEAEPTIGIYGVEGSKPGAAPAAVYLTHQVIRPIKTGYGKILGQTAFSCDKLYVRLLCMTDERFISVPLPIVPDSDVIPGDNEEAKIQYIRDNIDGKTNSEIFNDPQAMTALKELGPDLNILIYAFNYKTASGEFNTSLEKANLLNKKFYEKLSIDAGDDINQYNLIVSTTDFTTEAYGSQFIEHYKERLGVTGDPNVPITVIRSVIMDPWITETPDAWLSDGNPDNDKHSFIDVLETEIRKAVLEVIEENKEILGA
ncbi:group II decarboxylase family protein [Gloeothece citriformis PCC 7424]|uniref:Group II decarboxylase family protein n=1 Tax=Gloeothece citriformis (strain PCC 7424) TaxID=65393 RepID=B7KHI7_GLOC7|nr:pyridoxal-dependent decarboxylase [Gloeothece citriformis]ACK70682.1 group II decarboxylase family protein [Gloeothece citriformis PCC 7424]